MADRLSLDLPPEVVIETGEPDEIPPALRSRFDDATARADRRGRERQAIPDDLAARIAGR